MKATTTTIKGEHEISTSQDVPGGPEEILSLDFNDRVRQPHDDTSKDDQRHSVSDTAFGICSPSHMIKCRARGERDHRDKYEPDTRVW